MVAESMDASHVALLALTGKPVIGVFHTLSEGKDGHLVPGSIVPVPDAFERAASCVRVVRAKAAGAALAIVLPMIAAHTIARAHHERRVVTPDIFGWYQREKTRCLSSQ